MDKRQREGPGGLQIEEQNSYPLLTTDNGSMAGYLQPLVTLPHPYIGEPSLYWLAFTGFREVLTGYIGFMAHGNNEIFLYEYLLHSSFKGTVINKPGTLVLEYG